VFLLVFVFFHFNVLQRFELVTCDYRFILKGDRKADPRLAVIEISDDSVRKIGRWPWDRDWHAALIKILDELGAKAIVFDVIFSEPSDPAKDSVLSEAVKSSGRVYLAEVIEGSKKEVLTSIPSIAGGAKGGGHINLEPDVDGVMRRIPFFVEGVNKRIPYSVQTENKVPQLALAVAADELGLDLNGAQRRGSTVRFPLRKGGWYSIPVDAKGNFIINWVGRWKDMFLHHSYIDVMTAYAVYKKGGAPDLPRLFKDKIVFVGTTAAGLFDIRPTPLEPSYPAVGVNLNVLNNLLEGRFIKTVSYAQHLAVLFILMIILFRILKLDSYYRTTVLTAELAVAYVTIATALFVFFGIWLNVIYPLVLILLQYFFVTLYNQLSIAIERAQLLKLATRDSLTGLFNIGHFKLLMKAEITTISLRREKSLSLIMGDVDNFKRTNDTYGHVTGDAVLKEVAAAVKSNCRALDVAARYGGEEFILMLPGANLSQASKVAENIRKAIEQKVFFHEKGDFQTSISIGVTQISPDEKDLEAIVARADRALYEAKHSGKNKVVLASDSPKFAST
jgi:diguanylate cyclase (GGDEF)-like protein